MAWSAMGSAESLVQDLVRSSLRRAAGDVSGVRSGETFYDLSGNVRAALGRVCTERASLLSEVLESMAAAKKDIRCLQARHSEPCADISEQINDLVYEGFLEELEPGRLEHYPRYFSAILHRLEKLAADPRQDMVKMERVAPWWRRYQDLINGGAVYDHDLDTFRWLIQEFRVSVFAQHLGTDGKVSEKRLKESWTKLDQE
jgi:ATP-dependent helicase HrpA